MEQKRASSIPAPIDERTEDAPQGQRRRTAGESRPLRFK
jgi:hypothetical protein